MVIVKEAVSNIDVADILDKEVNAMNVLVKFDKRVMPTSLLNFSGVIQIKVQTNGIIIIKEKNKSWFRLTYTKINGFSEDSKTFVVHTDNFSIHMGFAR